MPMLELISIESSRRAGVHAGAVRAKGLATISTTLRFDNLNVLELGATARSTPSPFLIRFTKVA